MYDKTKIGNNKNCSKCKDIGGNKLSGPISFFHIGSKFEEDGYKIVFVGKNSWYDKEGFKEEAKGKLYADATETGRDSIKGEGDNCIKSPYWNYMRAIIEKLYNNDAFENVAITNLVKCNTTGEDGNPRDETSENIRKNCINGCNIFEREIKILKPLHIIFFTGRDYDDYIKRFKFEFKQHQIKDGNEQTKILNNKRVIWWEREFVENGRKIKTVRTYHPEYFVRSRLGDSFENSFVNEIVNWIKKS